jgi:hypothetical protein
MQTLTAAKKHLTTRPLARPLLHLWKIPLKYFLENYPFVFPLLDPFLYLSLLPLRQLQLKHWASTSNPWIASKIFLILMALKARKGERIILTIIGQQSIPLIMEDIKTEYIAFLGKEEPLLLAGPNLIWRFKSRACAKVHMHLARKKKTAI